MSQNREGRSSTPSAATQVEPSRTRLTGTLRLRGEHLPRQEGSTEQDPASSRRIRWAEDVVDNEGLGRKSSKVCCIFHKSRPPGESSSESDSDSEPSSSSDESDSDLDTGEARASNSRRRPAPQRRRRREQCHHEHGEDHVHCENEDDRDDNDDDDDGDGKESDKRGRSRPKRKYRPNAYERMPNYGIKKDPGRGKDGLS